MKIGNQFNWSLFSALTEKFPISSPLNFLSQTWTAALGLRGTPNDGRTSIAFKSEPALPISLRRSWVLTWSVQINCLISIIHAPNYLPSSLYIQPYLLLQGGLITSKITKERSYIESKFQLLYISIWMKLILWGCKFYGNIAIFLHLIQLKFGKLDFKTSSLISYTECFLLIGKYLPILFGILPVGEEIIPIVCIPKISSQIKVPFSR